MLLCLSDSKDQIIPVCDFNHAIKAIAALLLGSVVFFSKHLLVFLSVSFHFLPPLAHVFDVPFCLSLSQQWKSLFDKVCRAICCSLLNHLHVSLFFTVLIHVSVMDNL